MVDLAARMGKSAAAGRRFGADTLELGYRLPRTWARIEAGDLEGWKAQRIAQRTTQLSAPAAAWVDARVAARAHKIGHRQLDQLIGEALTLLDPDAAVETAQAPTYVHITPAGGAGWTG